MRKQTFNLSAWALGQQQLISFLMLTAMTAGILSNEDSTFTIKNIIIREIIILRDKSMVLTHHSAEFTFRPGTLADFVLLPDTGPR